MVKKANFIKFLMFPLIFCAGTVMSYAQRESVDSLVCRGDSLRKAYHFAESLLEYNAALNLLPDSLATQGDSLLRIEINDKILLSENSKNMSAFVYTPKVVASHQFSLDDFFLYYPMKDSSWRAVPNQLDSLGGPYAKALYAPSSADVIYYSTPDVNGIRNIYSISKADSLWTEPALLNEQMTSASDEIYPVLSEDGKSLYFASEGLYGVGGYDLYVSQWDEESNDWSAPVNMGFPYSSPENDFLLAPSPDGKYILFASDRDCPQDSVRIYVLENENTPVRSAMSDPAMLRELSRLEPMSELEDMNSGAEVKSDIPENVDTRRYMDKMAEIRQLRDSLLLYEATASQLREKYSLAENPDERQKVSEQILALEADVPAVQSRLDVAMKQLQNIEMDFLFNGVVIDPEKLLVDAEREIVGEDAGYAFYRMNLGERLALRLMEPKQEFDYSFKVLDEAQVFSDTLKHEGVIYQIQIMSSDRPATLRSFKGLSPVFDKVTASGWHIYRVGLFKEYKDVLPHLNTVKRLGFRNAYIVGFVDGEEKTVAEVRTIEKQLKEVKPKLFQVVVTIEGELDPNILAGIRQQADGRDIARTETGLVIGPFNNREQADAFVDFIVAMGYDLVEVLDLENN